MKTTTRPMWVAGILAALVCLCLAVPAAVVANASVTEFMSYDGLKKIKVRGLDLVYARPGATLATYDKVQLDPVTVAFAKGWKGKQAGSPWPLSQQQRDAIRERIAKVVYDAFVKELEAKHGYQIVTAPGPDVLRVRLYIIDVKVTAPDQATAINAVTISASAGQGVLVAELYDSQTGEILARVIDPEAAQQSGMMMINTAVQNQAQAEYIAQGWAKALRRAMDKAHDVKS
jgi:hypothetical protein